MSVTHKFGTMTRVKQKWRSIQTRIYSREALVSKLKKGNLITYPSYSMKNPERNI